MPRTLALGLTRIFRSRWGVAAVILVIVLAVVGVGRLLSGGSAAGQPIVTIGSPEPVISADPSDDDSVISAAPPPKPTTGPGKAEPEAVAYAFASAWVDHKNVSPKAWHDGILPNATKKLSDELDGVDPASVPASRVLGRPAVVPVGEGLVTAVVTVDSGRLSLRLVAPDGHWLVDGVDWNRS
jgi:hypothetical protein